MGEDGNDHGAQRGHTYRFDKVSFSDLNKKLVIWPLFDIPAGWHEFCTFTKGLNFACSLMLLCGLEIK